MKARSSLFIFMSLLLFVACRQSSSEAAPPEQVLPGAFGPFFGLKATSEAQMLLPGVISTRHSELNGSFNPEGTRFLWTFEDPGGNHPSIMSVQMQPDSQWSLPEIADFAAGHNTVDPVFSPDGSEIYFCSDRPVPGGREGSFHPWKVPALGGEATALSQLHTRNNDWYASADAAGNIWYSTWDSTRFTDDLFVVEVAGTPTNAGSALNTGQAEFDPFIAPDGSFILFASYRRDGFGNADIYVSFRSKKGWSQPQNLGEGVNTSAKEYCPSLNRDGSLFTFTSTRYQPAERPYPSTEALVESFDQVENGLGNVYFMEAKFIENLKETATWE